MLKTIIDEKIAPVVKLIGWLGTIITCIWFVFGMYNSYTESHEAMQQEMNTIRKMVLRDTIWNYHIPMHDRLEACDEYLDAGYNSETKIYCEKLIEEAKKEAE